MKKMLSYIFPIWFGMTINTLLGMTDMFFLNRIDIAYLSAIGAASVWFSIISTLFIGVGIEANRRIAAGGEMAFNRLLILLLGLALGVSMLASASSRALFFYIQDETLKCMVTEYFGIYVYAQVPSIVLYLCTGVLRGRGESKKTAYFSALAVGLNIILDAVFIGAGVLRPLFGCGFASVLSDCITASIYFIYIKMYVRHRNITNLSGKEIRTFLKNSVQYSLEKLFSTSSLLILSGIYIALLPVEQSRIYYGTDKMFSPILMLSYSYFEWVIYAKSQKIAEDKRVTYFWMGFCCFGVGIISTWYLKGGLIFCLLYGCYMVCFCMERDVVASMFCLEQAKVVNRMMGIKAVALIVILQFMTWRGILWGIGILLVQIIACIIVVIIGSRKLLEKQHK